MWFLLFVFELGYDLLGWFLVFFYVLLVYDC